MELMIAKLEKPQTTLGQKKNMSCFRLHDQNF